MRDELTPSQAAKRIGATTRSVQRWIASGRLPARRVGNRWRVASDAIDALVASEPPAGEPVRPIRTLFIANRGEIAHRITRTCDRLGIRAVVPPTVGAVALDLLEPLREELDHRRASLLGTPFENLHGDAAQVRQRKVLFSFSKKPSSWR